MTSAADTAVFEALERRDVATPLGRVRVYVGGSGDATPILFWPSLLMGARMWAAQAAHFSVRHRVVLVDPPGHGGSEPLTRGFDFDACADTIAAILDALHIEKAHLVGNSWGGMIGGTFAARHPLRLGKAVLMNATASACGPRQKLEYRLLVAVVPWLGFRGPLAKTAVEAFTGPTSRRERPEVVQTIRDTLGQLDLRSVRWAIRSVVPARPDQHAAFAAIRAPVLVVAGEEDATFSVAETRAMADSIPGARFVVMPATAHLAALEQPVAVNRLIEDFLAEAS